MTDQQIKAEAEKIIQEFKPFVELEPFYSNKGGTIQKSIEYNATQCAIIQVKALIKENHHMDNEFDLPVKVVDILSRRLDHFQSILTQLEKR